MDLNIGAQLGPYEIQSALGAGGMGEVYRAHDTILGRDVAIKVLPEAFAGDSDRLARFQREARILASLNHPNIGGIYGLEQSAGRIALVMELVEGEDLSQRISRGPLSPDEALPIAKQMAEALEAAHEQGIIHRDLKPANIKVRADGTVKVLDFGLAKSTGLAWNTTSSSQSPSTITAEMTQAGAILGTAAYMSPEQAAGKPADKRSDAWSFGCVLFEMLAGHRAFAGATLPEILANVVHGQPNWDALPPRVPVRIRELLRRCLAKDRKHRLADLHDAALEIDDALARNDSSTAAATWWFQDRPKAAVLATAVALLVGSAAGVWIGVRSRVATPRAPVHFTVAIPEGVSITSDDEIADVPSFTPDGRTVFVAARPRAGGLSVYKISLDEPGMALVAHDFSSPLVSLDGRTLAVVRDTALFKMPVEGGPAVPIKSAVGQRAAWLSDHEILVARGDTVSVINDRDGSLRTLDWKSEPLRLVHMSRLNDDWILGQTITHRIVAANVRTLEYTVITEGTSPMLAPSGHLIFHRAGALWGVRFDARTKRLTGEPVPLIPEVAVIGGAQRAAYSISAAGDLVYAAAGTPSARALVWYDREGRRVPATSETGPFSTPRLSPSGRLAAVVDGSAIAIIDLGRGSRVRIGVEGSENRRPVWTRDGTWVVFQANADIYRQRSDGSAPPELLLNRPGMQYPDDVSADGVVAFNEPGEGGRDLLLLRGQSAEALLATSANERGLAFSTSGELLAYTSDESGRDEIYLRRLEPSRESKTVVSTRGGSGARWSRDGRELFYREGESMMVVEVSPEGRLAMPKKLFDIGFATNPNEPGYDVHPDGRFLTIEERTRGRHELRFILNWTEELKRRLR